MLCETHSLPSSHFGHSRPSDQQIACPRVPCRPAASGRGDTPVADDGLGAVLRGQVPHFDVAVLAA
jgi:hypothetical protein